MWATEYRIHSALYKSVGSVLCQEGSIDSMCSRKLYTNSTSAPLSEIQSVLGTHQDWCLPSVFDCTDYCLWLLPLWVFASLLMAPHWLAHSSVHHPQNWTAVLPLWLQQCLPQRHGQWWEQGSAPDADTLQELVHTSELHKSFNIVVHIKVQAASVHVHMHTYTC